MPKMFTILTFLLIISLMSCFHNQSLSQNFRRIAQKHYKAEHYPRYILHIRIRLHGKFVHQCMGTLLSHTWSITSDHCFIKGWKVPSDYLLYHGSKLWEDCLEYDFIGFEAHEEDIALLNHARINIPSNEFPKLSRTFCLHDVRVVYFSYGFTNENNQHSNDLLYSSNDIDDDLCHDYELEKVFCFKPIDGTLPMHGDSGAGVMTGYGPGPMFPHDTHDLKLVGLMEAFFDVRENRNSTKEIRITKSRRLSKYIGWIQDYVTDVKIV